MPVIFLGFSLVSIKRYFICCCPVTGASNHSLNPLCLLGVLLPRLAHGIACNNSRLIQIRHNRSPFLGKLPTTMQIRRVYREFCRPSVQNFSGAIYTVLRAFASGESSVLCFSYRLESFRSKRIGISSLPCRTTSTQVQRPHMLRPQVSLYPKLSSIESYGQSAL